MAVGVRMVRHGDDKQPGLLGELRSHERANRVAVAIGCLLLAALLASAVAGLVLAQGGDNDPRFVRILNQTDEKLTIFVVSGGQRNRLLSVAPQTVGRLFSECPSSRLVAVGPDDLDVASRPPSEQCNLADWIIRSKEG